MKNKINELVTASIKEINNSKDLKQLDELRVSILGKKGSLSLLMPLIKDLDDNGKKEFGLSINLAKKSIEDALISQKEILEDQKLLSIFENEKIDLTAPSINLKKGSIHPLNIVIQDVEDYFIARGYKIAQGPELEEDHYNFEMMNIQKDHPARDMHDTFYITDNLLLRTHTSPVQARYMLANKNKEIAIIAPGKTYRRDQDDATHSHQFMQIEGLVVSKNVSFGALKQTLLDLAKHLFGNDKQIRLRPSFFPFTEPSVEVDVLFTKKDGSTMFIELLGAGMVHPNVLKSAGFNPNEFSGFAFGIGVERIAMLKYQVDDIRHFYQNDIRFLNQFKGK